MLDSSDGEAVLHFAKDRTAPWFLYHRQLPPPRMLRSGPPPPSVSPLPPHFYHPPIVGNRNGALRRVCGLPFLPFADFFFFFFLTSLRILKSGGSLELFLPPSLSVLSYCLSIRHSLDSLVSLSFFSPPPPPPPPHTWELCTSQSAMLLRKNKKRCQRRLFLLPMFFRSTQLCMTRCRIIADFESSGSVVVSKVQAPRSHSRMVSKKLSIAAASLKEAIFPKILMPNLSSTEPQPSTTTFSVN